MAQAPHPVFPSDPAEQQAQQPQLASPLPTTHLTEMLRGLRGRRLDRGDLVTAELVDLAINELDTRLAVINSLRRKIDEERRRNAPLMMAEKISSAPLLPGELPRRSPQLPMRDNPPPDSRSPLELVVAEKTAIRALVRHYDWVHDGPDTLLRCRTLTPAELVAVGWGAAPLVEEQVEAPGTIADLAAAADQEVAAETAAVPSCCGGVE